VPVASASFKNLQVLPKNVSKAALIAAVTADLTGKVKAGELVNFVAGQVGGKGGGNIGNKNRFGGLFTFGYFPAKPVQRHLRVVPVDAAVGCAGVFVFHPPG